MMMKRYKHIILALVALLFMATLPAGAQSVDTLRNGDTIFLDACALGGGTIYDDGGPTGNYSNNFDGWVVITSNPGVTVTVTGNYETESPSYDYFTIWEDNVLMYNNIGGSGSLNFTSTSGRLVIRFHTDVSVTYSGFALVWSIDGVSGTCTNSISNLTANNITSTTASFSWTAESVSGPFTLEYNGVRVNGITSTSYTLNNLNPNTRYVVAVVATADTAIRCCADNVVIRTDCGSIEFPWTEGFEDLDYVTFPPCWLMQKNFDEVSYVPKIDMAHASSGFHSLMFSCGGNNTSEHFGMVATPPMAGTGMRVMHINMMASHNYTPVQVGLCDSAGVDSNNYGFVPITMLNVSSSWSTYRIEWNATVSGQRLAFRMEQSQQNGTGRMVYLDEMGVEGCGVDSIRATHLDYDRLTLVWTSFGNPTCTVKVRRAGTDNDSLISTNAVSPLDITGLDASQTYTFTVLPYCGSQPSFGRSITVTMPVMPADATAYCTDFRGNYGLPNGWTFIKDPASSFSNNGSGIHYSSGYYPSHASAMVTERLLNLAGKRVVIEYSTTDGGTFRVGTLQYADDTSSFVLLGSENVNTDGHVHTVTFDVPSTNTGRHLAITMHGSYYRDCTFKAVEIGESSCVVGHEHLVHRRGTSVQLDWGAVYDTIIVQYGVQNFSIGSGQQDTFYNASRGTVEGLSVNTYYDFYVYRPCGHPCPDRVISTRTATADYLLPYCEDFSTLTSNCWSSGSGDWLRPNMVNSTPRINTSEDNLEMASWGFAWDYYSTVELPDVELSGSSVLSFYATGTYPSGYIIVGAIPEGYSGNYFYTFDTIHLGNGAYRTHYTYQLPSNSILYDCRLALKFQHPYEYQFYRVYIDELQITHASYGSANVTFVGYDTATVAVHGLTGTDSVTVTLVGGGNTFSQSVVLADTAAIGFGGLQPATFYNIYVQPFDGGCYSFVGSFITQSDGGGGGGGINYANCFSFTDVLSYELPLHWATTDTHYVNPNDELELPAHSALVMHPASYVSNNALLFHATSTVNGDTLILGTYAPSDTISTDSTHFTFDNSLFFPIDTMVLTPGGHSFARKLPVLPTGNRRICFLTGQGTVSLGNIGISSCPIVHFTTDGSDVICTVDGGGSTLYFLTIDDSASTMHRVLRVDESPFHVLGLEMNKTYYLSVQCPYLSSACTQDTVIRTGSLIPLPYCDYFNQSYTNISVPSTWKIIKTNSSQSVTPTTSPSLQFNPGYNQWLYAVLPDFQTDSALSLYMYFELSNYNNQYDDVVQVGVMDDENNISTFIPVYSQKARSTNYSYSYYTAEVDLSAYMGKRVAIRCSRTMYLYNVRVYGIPTVSYALPHAGALKITSSVDHPYWLHESYGSTNHMVYINENPVYRQYNTTSVSLLPTMDAAGNTCESMRTLNLGTTISVPFCFPAYYNLNYFSYFNTVSGGYSSLTFYRGAWMVMPELQTDSLQRIHMRVDYQASTATDTLVVGVVTDAYDTLTFVPVDTLVYTSSEGYQTAYVDFSAYADTGRWVTMHYLNHDPSSGYSQYVYVKEIIIDTCPGAMGASVKLHRWNQVKIDAPAVPFYVEYYPTYTSSQGLSGNTILRIDTVPFILTLNPDQKYDFYFHCDSLGYSCRQAQQVTTLAAPLWVPGCVDFDTVPIGNLPGSNWNRRINTIGASNVRAHSGNRSMAIPINNNAYLITPDADIDSIQKVTMSIWYYAEDASDRLVVGVMSNPDDLNTYHPIRTLAPGVAGTWQRGLVEFSSAPDDAFFLVFFARSNHLSTGRSIYIDDIYLDTNIAFDLRVSEIASNSLTLDWNHIGSPDVTITVLDDDEVMATYSHAEPPLLIEPLSILHYYTILFEGVSGTDTVNCNTNFKDTLSLVTPAPGVGCINATDLNSPQAVFFSGAYDNPYSEAGAINYGPMHPDSRHTVCYDTAQRDPRTGNQLRTIPEGYTSSVRLGNWSTNYFQPEAEGVIYGLYVDTSNFELLLLRYAAVLQDPMHAAADQPRFRMELLDTNYNIIDSVCTSADFIADRSLGWNTADDGVLWKDWTAVGVDLSSHAGEHVYFRLTTYDCNEGSHYGYAYFTLECMRKNMNTVSCGDVDSNTLKAPEGFHYRWYTSQSTATFSTEQNITVPSEDITYYCEVSKLDNASCMFVISAYGGTRYPIAAFDTSMVVDSCQFYVNFTNHSGISRDGINLIPGEDCETYYWDFGNGSISTSRNPHTMYPLPGIYTVRLISGIGMNECQDTAIMTLELTIPDGMRPADTTVVSICDNQSYTFFGQPYTVAGDYFQLVSVPNQLCDSLYMLRLDVRATSSSDSVAMACDSISWRGQTYTTDGIYPSGPIGLNAVGCDTSVNLILSVFPTYDTVDTIVVCPYRPFVYRGVDYGGPASFDTTLYSIDNCDSVVHVTLTPRDTNFRLAPYYYFDSLPLLTPDTMLVSCATTELNLIDSTKGAFQWRWRLFMPDTVVADSLQQFYYEFQSGRDSASAYLTLVTTSEGNCLDTIGWPVFVFPSPKSDYSWSPRLPSILSPEVQLSNLATPLLEEIDTNHSLNYLWRIQAAEGGEFDTTSVFAPRYHWGETGDNMAGDYLVQLVTYWTHPADSFYTSDLPWLDSTFYHTLMYPAFTHTCIDTMGDTITITNEYLQFPNLVTPNGDGINDTWEVVNLVEMGNYPMNELWIYDRTGALIYHVRNISRSEQFWDPNATRSADGTYYYRFLGEGIYGVVKRNGVIEVLRK